MLQEEDPMSPDVPDQLRPLMIEREQIRLAHNAGAAGTTTVRNLTGALDRAISLMVPDSTGKKAAVAAVGEYGRGHTPPFAEIELLIIAADNPDALGDEICNALWAAGVEAGFQVCAPEPNGPPRSDMNESIKMLDARLVTGNQTLFEAWQESTITRLMGSSDEFSDSLRESTKSRHMSGDDVTAALEPDLKAGNGGLEDLAAIQWINLICAGESVVSADDLASSAEAIHRARCEIQYFTGRYEDLLKVDYRDPVGRRLLGTSTAGAHAGGAASPEVALMSSVYRAGRTIAFALEQLLYPDDPARAAAQAFEAALAAGKGQTWAGEARRAFVNLLSINGLSSFRALDHSGAWLAAIPEWASIQRLPQRSSYHHFAVDVHCVQTAATAAQLGADPDVLVKRIAGNLNGDKETLLWAALLHDIGKGSYQDHSQVGEELARKVLERAGVPAIQAADVCWLVKNHLLLSQTATRRDITDESLLWSMSETIQSTRRLNLLFLLSVADGKATGPAAWSTWKAGLISRLFTRLAHILETPEGAGPGGAPSAHEQMEAIRSALSGYPGLEEHLAAMPRAWLLAQPCEALIDQTRAMLEFTPSNELEITATGGRREDTWALTIVGRDRPGLFSKVSGILALHDLNALKAEIYTRQDGLALEIVNVEALADEEGRFDHIAADVRSALHGRIGIDMRLSQKRLNNQAPTSTGGQDNARIVVDNESSDLSTLVEVHASDRVGRLYAITRALADLELDIQLAKVSTYGRDIVDVFYVSDMDGAKIVDPEYLVELEKTILHRLQAN